MNPKLLQFLLGCFVAVGSFNYGYDNAVITEVIASDAFKRRFQPTATETGAVVSVFTGGAFFGALIAGGLTDWTGRRATIFAGCIIFYLGTALQTGATNLGCMYAGRIFAGMAVGVFFMVIPIYQSEIAHPSIRGRITALQQSFLGVGAVLAGWITYGCYVSLKTDAQYRLPLGLQMVPTFFLTIFIFMLPESPRWLVLKGKTELGLKTLAKLHSNGDIADAFVLSEFALIQADVDKEIANKAIPMWKLVFSNKSNFRRIFMAITLQFSVQMTGVSAVSYFTPEIYALLNIDTAKSLLLNACSGILNLFVAQTTCIYIVDKFGRRWPIIIAHALQGLCFIASAIILAKYPVTGYIPHSAQIGYIACTWIFGVIFAVPGTTSWIIPAEIFNIQIRAVGVSTAAASSFASNTMISQVTSIGLQNLGYKFWFLFIVGNFTNAIFFYCFLPETGKVPLEKMDDMWEDMPLFIPTWNRRNYLEELEENAHNIEVSGVLDVKDEKADHQERVAEV